MANNVFEDRMIRTHRSRAREWLLAWAEKHADEVVNINEPNLLQLLDIGLPNNRQVVFSARMDEARADLFLFCSLGRDVPVWRHGCPADLLDWLSDGMPVRPTRVFYSHGQNFLMLGLELQLLEDWGQTMEVTLPMVGILIAYLTRLRASVMEANGLPSLDCPEAEQFRRCFQDEFRAYPILTEVVNPEALKRPLLRRRT